MRGGSPPLKARRSRASMELGNFLPETPIADMAPRQGATRDVTVAPVIRGCSCRLLPGLLPHCLDTWCVSGGVDPFRHGNREPQARKQLGDLRSYYKPNDVPAFPCVRFQTRLPLHLAYYPVTDEVMDR